MQIKEKPKTFFRWLIIAIVMGWSVFQITPSIRSISSGSENRSSIASLLSPVEESEQQFKNWVLSYCSYIGVAKPKFIQEDKRFIECLFATEKDAKKFKKYASFAFDKIKDPRIQGIILTPEQALGKEVRIARTFISPETGLFNVQNIQLLTLNDLDVDREYDEDLFRSASALFFNVIHSEQGKSLQSISQFEIAFRTLVVNSKKVKPSITDERILSDIISYLPYGNEAALKLQKAIESSLDQMQSNLSLGNDGDVSFLSKKKADLERLYQIAKIVDVSSSSTFSFHTPNRTDLTKYEHGILCDAASILNQEKDFSISCVKEHWQPESNDLLGLHCVDANDWGKLNSIEQSLSLLYETNPLYPDSQFIVLKGFGELLNRSGLSESAQHDLVDLFAFLRKLGYTTSDGFSAHFNPKSDLLLEKSHVVQQYLAAIHPHFTIFPSQTATSPLIAILPFDAWKDVQEGSITQLSKFQNNLIEAKTNFFAAKSGLNNLNWFEVPPPTKNLLWENFKLSLKKYWLCLPPWCLKWGIDLTGGKSLKIQVCDAQDRNIDEKITLAITEIRERVDKFGLSDILIRKQGNYLNIDLPASSPSAFKSILESPRLRFHIVDEESIASSSMGAQLHEFMLEVWNRAKTSHQTEGLGPHKIACELLYGEGLDFENPKPQTELAKLLFGRGFRLANAEQVRTGIYTKQATLARLILPIKTTKEDHPLPLLPVYATAALSGDELDEIGTGFESTQGHYLSFSIRNAVKNQTSSPRSVLGSWTKMFCKDNIHKSELGKSTGGRGWRMAVVLQDEIISAPSLEAPIDERGMISGNFSELEVKNLSKQLKMGKLSFEPKIIEEISIEPEMGKLERNRGLLGLAVSLLLVIGLMITYYRFGGLVASVALVLNLVLMWAVLQSLQAAISFPTLAGAILTLGMAVDANVLVFERIREELTQGQSLKKALSAGYAKAMAAIVDSNITTILAGIILACVDSGAVRGFALSLIVGIVSSMFTSLFCTRTYFTRWASKTRQTTLSMLKFHIPKTWNFVRHSTKAWVACSVLFTTAVFGYLSKDHSILGIDLSGGYATIIQMQNPSENSRGILASALVKGGFDRKDFQLQPLRNAGQFRLQISKKLGSKLENPSSLIQLLKPNLSLDQKAEELVLTSWSSVSGQFSSKMVLFSTLGLGFAILGIFIYLALRFTPPFAISASLAMLVDLGLALCMIGVLRIFGLYILIDLQVIAALMTIIGYSLNDKIIIFDRIREQLKLKSFTGNIPAIVDLSVASTLSRTFLTSFSTLIVVIPMLFFPSSSIFPFAITMACGIILGTLSSLYLAAPLVARLLGKSRSSVEVLD